MSSIDFGHYSAKIKITLIKTALTNSFESIYKDMMEIKHLFFLLPFLLLFYSVSKFLSHFMYYTFSTSALIDKI